MVPSGVSNVKNSKGMLSSDGSLERLPGLTAVALAEGAVRAQPVAAPQPASAIAKICSVFGVEQPRAASSSSLDGRSFRKC